MTSLIQDSQSLLEHILSNTSRVFTPPAHALKVVEMAEREDTTAAELKQLIESDPGLTVKILKIVNSGAFGVSRNVAEVGQAITLLGIRAVRLLALGFSLPREELECESGEINKLNWRFSVVKAVTARQLMNQFYSTLDGDIAFVAGLLQDLGVLILLNELGEPYAEFLVEVNESGKNLNELEIDSLGFSHKQLTARLLDQWNLPESIVLAVGQSFAPTVIKDLGSPEKETAQALHLAELVAQVVTFQNEQAAQRFLAHGKDYLGLTTEQANQVLTDMEESASRLAESMEIEIGKFESQAELLARAHEHLAKMTEEQIRESVMGLANTNEAESATATAILAGKKSIAEQLRCGELNLAGSDTHTGIHVESQGDLTEQIIRFASDARDQYQPFSLTLIALNPKHAQTPGGLARKSLFVIRQLAQKVWEYDGNVLHVPEIGLAIFSQQDRLSCVRLMRQVMQGVDTWNRIQRSQSGEKIVFHMGIACMSMVPRNMSPDRLKAAAHDCLQAAMKSDGHSIKSIDVL
jgi:HD-like signal output (HDOD) protein